MSISVNKSIREDTQYLNGSNSQYNFNGHIGYNFTPIQHDYSSYRQNIQTKKKLNNFIPLSTDGKESRGRTCGSSKSKEKSNENNRKMSPYFKK